MNRKRIITHKEPDGDALCAVWLATRFLFADTETDIVFVSRRPLPEDRWGADCVVDVGGVYDLMRLVFDHKPPAFEDRNAHCASELLYNYLLTQSKPVVHLAPLVGVVHEGDCNPPRRGSVALRESRSNGFHAYLREARWLVSSDAELYQSVGLWLDALSTSLLSPES